MTADERSIDAAFAPTIRRFSGFADRYDRHRPSPPPALETLLAQFVGDARPALVVDLGCGTGLSSRYWADKAVAVKGVEPSADMRAAAEAATPQPNVSYVEGFSHRTGLADRSATIVTCVQSLHWMEPAATFAEARRLLAPGGVFACLDYDWPPVTRSWQVDRHFIECTDRIDRLERTLPPERRPPRWPKEEHLARMRASGSFAYTREALLHHWEDGDADRYCNMLRSHGGVMALLESGHTDRTLGLDRFDAEAHAAIGETTQRWQWSTRVRIGVV